MEIVHIAVDRVARRYPESTTGDPFARVSKVDIPPALRTAPTCNRLPHTPPMTPTSDTDWYEVTFSVPWIVRNVATAQDAINIAVAELGKRVAKAGESIRNADITVQSACCRGCETEMDVATVVSGRALVGLLLTVEVRASCPEESGIIGQREIGPHVPDTPLTLVESSG
jgi:hypothetical protein